MFSTYHGGDRFDDARGVAVDANGFVYVVGQSDSRDLSGDPVGGKPLTSAVFRGYLTKYGPDGREVVWRKWIGGSSNTVANAVAVDHLGDIFVAGTTGARDLPLKNPVQDKQPGLNIAFLMKFNADGELLFSTYFGGERNEEGKALAVDAQNNVYLAGRATSTTMPTVNALQAKFGGSEDGFVAKYSATDLRLAYATYVGGDGADQIHSIAVGPDDSLYVTGETMSAGMATPNAYIRQMPSWSSFVARIKPDGTGLEYFTYIGWRGGYTTARTIAVDNQGRAWVGGHTSVKEMPTTDGALQRGYAGGLRDGFFLRLSDDGQRSDYTSYFGGGNASGPGDPDEYISALKIDAYGHLHIAGQTNSPSIPYLFREAQNYFAGAFDNFLARVDIENNQVIYSTWWGGAKQDSPASIALGPGEAVTVVGSTESTDTPVTESAVQKQLGSASGDGFAMQFCDPWPSYVFTGEWNHEFEYVKGSGVIPEAREIEVVTGCRQKFPIENNAPEVEGGGDWLKVTADGEMLPMKLKLELSNLDSLAAGEYKVFIRVRVPDAYHPLLEIPVVLRVS
ncbi:hypothetical protein F183_A03140 [Bryobacterales bacterium F-183]|nr:hypothetical protein F183_A03140 [Bryobacterales bacterium F-183]